MDINQIALKQKVIAYLNNVIDSVPKKFGTFCFLHPILALVKIIGWSEKMTKIKALLFYYIIVSLVFFSGRFYIMKTYNMKQGPVPSEAFLKLFDWVDWFSYLYIIPLLIVGLIRVIRFAQNRNASIVLRILIGLLYILLAAGAGLVLKFIFILLFYGFAP
ncbi:hypothetical protein EDM52_21405 [Brevibacillus invocatus]|uniref:Uncharacterized protein n=1 Tax=Brevibacillus invocatus TaxID=173959 RepID=A0A3M8BY73_9BACL|nr:hypothetical protein [Brevibacillus invocatus]RNB68047.1 hypothetical protein EDM52_21405 [Brevibacillus invocatus]